ASTGTAPRGAPPRRSMTLPLMVVPVIEVGRQIDDDRDRAEEQAGLEPERGRAVKQAVPPAVRHEGGEDDRDRPIVALVDPIDVLEQRRHERTVRRLDDVKRDLAGPVLPPLAELSGALLARRDVNRLDGRRDRAGECDGPRCRTVQPPYRNDHHRRATGGGLPGRAADSGARPPPDCSG